MWLFRRQHDWNGAAINRDHPTNIYAWNTYYSIIRKKSGWNIVFDGIGVITDTIRKLCQTRS
jgi:hypothetical protein